jgi:2,3-bisphosphoglycerate-independent phosphoglycerate mutase
MTVILAIIDGLGVCDNPHQSIPFIQNRLDKAILLEASGEAVGLIDGQMGNSEVGHMTMGGGRIIQQNLTRIDNAIAKDQFPEIQGEVFHIIGLLSDGGVHSHINHILHIINKLSNKKVFIHIITDGRDTPPKSIEKYLVQLSKVLLDQCEIATISGRYYAMDRDNRTERTNKAFDAIAFGKSDEKYNSQFIRNQYNQGITDEFFLPTANISYHGISPEDTVVFCNFRSDRMRQIVRKIYTEIPCKEIISMVDYFNGELCDIKNFFISEKIENTLGQIIAKTGMKQLRIAETEKYAHVTFFFNCGQEDQYIGEDRILIPSPKVATYDLQPEMAAYQVIDSLICAINKKEYDFICVNFANADMVGHTGNVEAAAKACIVIDECLEKLAISATQNQYVLIVTADHGNIEQMLDDLTNQPHTAHTLNKVPLICLGCDLIKINNYSYGLRDIAPTILKILRISQPCEMTGKSLV